MAISGRRCKIAMSNVQTFKCMDVCVCVRVRIDAKSTDLRCVGARCVDVRCEDVRHVGAQVCGSEFCV